MVLKTDPETTFSSNSAISLAGFDMTQSAMQELVRNTKINVHK